MKKLVILLAILNFNTIYGQDRLFTYTYQSNVLSKGQKELEIWNTLRSGRKDYYSRFDNRSEFEIGLGSKLQTAFYLNLTSITSSTDINSIKSLETEHEISFSNEWKLKLMDPVADPLGLALYFEYGIGSSEYEIEGKLIIDKRISNLTIAANAVYELEYAPLIEADQTAWAKENLADFDLAFAWSVSPKFAVTLENTFKNVFVNGELEHSALYTGPGFSWVQSNFWMNFTLLPQVVSFKGQSGSSLNLNEFEKIQFRLIFSYVL
jgi:hypothetical protein